LIWQFDYIIDDLQHQPMIHQIAKVLGLNNTKGKRLKILRIVSRETIT